MCDHSNGTFQWLRHIIQWGSLEIHAMTCECTTSSQQKMIAEQGKKPNAAEWPLFHST